MTRTPSFCARPDSPCPPAPGNGRSCAATRGRRATRASRARPGRRRLTGRKASAIVSLFLVGFLVGAANLIFTVHYIRAQQSAQQQAGLVTARKLCATLDSLAALKPLGGNPAANPSRAYEDHLHATLDGLGQDLGCR